MCCESSCNVYDLFPNADQLITETPKGHIISVDELKIPFWAIQGDPLNVPGCQMALVKFLDGSPIAVRYRISQFVIY